MKFSVNNHQYEVVAQGGDLFITTEQGTFQLHDSYEGNVGDDDIPYLFHAAMAVVYEGQTIKSFDEFEELFFSGTGLEEGEELEAVVAQDRADYERSAAAAKEWAKFSTEQASVILNYLESTYHI